MLIMRPFLFVLFTLVLFATSCKPDPKIPQWDVETLTPLVSSRLDIGDILADSSLSVDADGFVSVVYQNKLATILPDEIIKPLDASFSNTIKLSDINLGSPSINDAISLGHLCSNGAPVSQFILFNNGKKAIIPAFSALYNLPFVIDATNIFQSITLISGQMTIEFFNDLPITLTDISFNLKNNSSGTVLLQKTIDTIHSQATYSETFSLDGKTIDGQLAATLIKLGTPGSGADSVLIDTSRKIFISISLDNLVPSSATAIFPDQILANDTSDTEIQTGNAELTAVKVKDGSIYLNASSTIEDEISLDYSIPGAKLNSQPMQINEKVPPATPSSMGVKNISLDISEYEIDLTGRPSYMGIYNTFYTILQGRIDSSGNLVNLSLQDSVLLQTGISGLTAKAGYGYLGKDTSETNDINKVLVFSELISSDFDLEEAIMMVAFENNIGAPIDIRVNELLASTARNSQSINAGNSANLNWNDLGSIKTIPAATLSNAGLPQPSRLEIVIDKSNSNLDELIEITPNYFKTSVTSYLNGSLAAPDYNQFIFSEYGIETYLNLEIPLHFSAADIHLTDSLPFNYFDLDKDGQLQKGVLKLISRNHFPLEGKVDIYLIDDIGTQIGTLYSSDIIKPANTDAGGKAISEIKSVLEYPLSNEQVAQLKKTTHIVMDVHLNTPAPGQKVKLYDTDYLDLTLAGDLTIRTK